MELTDTTAKRSTRFMRKKRNKKIGFFSELYQNRHIYTLMIPGLLFFIMFCYMPMFGHIIAFEKYSAVKGLFGSELVGFSNFEFFFLTDDWLTVTLNTLKLNSLFIVFNMTISVALALFLMEFRSTLVKRSVQSLLLLPYFVSWVVVYFMAQGMLSTREGIVNNLLESLGLERYAFYSDPNIWPTLLTIMYVWKNAGYTSIIFFAAINAIDPTYYESAVIDGATKFRQVIHITLPLIRNTIIVMFLLAIGRIFYGDFGMIYGIVGDNSVLFSTTDIIDTYVYRLFRVMGNMSMSAAIGLYQSVLGIVVVVIFNGIARRVDPDARLF